MDTPHTLYFIVVLFLGESVGSKPVVWGAGRAGGRSGFGVSYKIIVLYTLTLHGCASFNFIASRWLVCLQTARLGRTDTLS